MTIYFISGLGADKRVFKKLSLPSHFEIKHVEWIPNTKNESLVDYTKRLLTQIDTSKPFSLVGLSFGGMVATELAKITKPKQVIIISSVSTSKQIPWYFKIHRVTNFLRVLPPKLLKTPNRFLYWIFGTKNEEQKELLTQIMYDTDVVFLKWAVSKIVRWNNKHKAEGLYHIHGTADKIFPIKFIKPDIEIIGGGHFMVYDKHEEISKILAERLTA
jgi:pimeloyl-ACP methyl ester carboxylesterase